MKQQYHVELSPGERGQQKKHLRSKKHSHESKKRAEALLELDESEGRIPPPVQVIAAHAGVSAGSVRKYRKQYATDGLESVLLRKKRSVPPVPPKVTGEVEAYIIATCCSEPPEGKAVWTMQMIANKIVLDGIVDSISDETVRLVLKKRNSSPI
ncbi:helix-turn-helix domain-containing protein [Eubacteriales bacterium OttesenSCG-928-A19]|nr:helix-turn-helix domain-containing protein [Eubacteriales bacterium OttesenSCG-928-A19]